MSDMGKEFRNRVEGLREVLEKTPTITMPAKLKVRGRAGEEMTANAEAEVEALEAFLRDFIKTRMTPFVSQQMHGADKNPSPWMPKVLEGLEKFHRYAQPRQETHVSQRLYDKFRGGFGQMLKAVTTTEIESKPGRVMAHMGPEPVVMGMKLSDYSVLRHGATPTKYNSFFMAAEFGTGIHADPRWFHNDPPSKEPDGSWWVINEKGTMGAHFEGQKPMHAFFKPGTKTIKPVYAEFIRANLYPALDEFLANKYPEGNFFRT
jgi:hypothetical protein